MSSSKRRAANMFRSKKPKAKVTTHSFTSDGDPAECLHVDPVPSMREYTQICRWAAERPAAFEDDTKVIEFMLAGKNFRLRRVREIELSKPLRELADAASILADAARNSGVALAQLANAFDQATQQMSSFGTLRGVRLNDPAPGQVTLDYLPSDISLLGDDNEDSDDDDDLDY